MNPPSWGLPISSDRSSHLALTEHLWSEGSERGEHIASFIDRVVGDLRTRAVLDVGCATGGITRVLADRAASAVGIDRSWGNVSAAARREPSARGRLARFAQSDAIRLPFRTATFDVALMSGVLEYMGFAKPDRPPRTGQLLALREVGRIMSAGGHLFVGIENRWFPKFLLRSPHQELWLALLLPTRVAWAMPRWVFGAKVHECLHGHSGLRTLLQEAGFDDVKIYLPIFGYQFPREFVPSEDPQAVLDAVERSRIVPRTRFEQVANGGKWGRAWFQAIATLRLQSWLAPSFYAVARKHPA